MKFYNPKLSMITIGVSMAKGTVQIAMAKTLDPNMTGRPEKGQKIYDWDNTVYFSLSSSECLNILDSLKSILDGTYVNNNEKNDKFKKIFSFTHYKDSQPSRILIDRAKDAKGNALGSIVMTILPSKNEGLPVTYAFRQNELILFKFYIENGARYMEFGKDVYEAIERINYGKCKKEGGNQSQYKGQYNQQSNYKQNNTEYKKEKEVPSQTSTFETTMSDPFDMGGASDIFNNLDDAVGGNW